MRFLRRSAASNQAEPATDGQQAPPSGTGGRQTPSAGKGRPTPKRREAEARRRGPVAPPPRTQREAMRRSRGSKEERRSERAERRARMMAGDDRYLLPRDRGEVRAYVRDLVDSRRQIMGLFMPLAGLVLLTLVVPNPRVQNVVSLTTMAMLLVIVFETFLLGRYIRGRVQRKFPNATDSGAGLTFYAFSRATMLRRLRTPRPRVGYGEVPD